MLRAVLVLLSLLNLVVLLMSILMVKPVWIGLSIGFFALMAAFQNYDQSGKSKVYLILEEELNNAG